jgi:hypothetical protein
MENPGNARLEKRSKRDFEAERSNGDLDVLSRMTPRMSSARFGRKPNSVS